jgi:tRNA-dihydrouridine synthase C
MRLGIADTASALACARALEAGGAESIVVHARTKQDGYKPPARWEWLMRIRDTLRIPVIANGEVWTLDDYIGIRAVSGCDDVMLGRGAVADPMLAARIRHWQESGVTQAEVEADWNAVRDMLARFWTLVNCKLPSRHTPGRLKQWLGLMRRAYPQAENLYVDLREVREAEAVAAVLKAHDIAVHSLRAAA